MCVWCGVDGDGLGDESFCVLCSGCVVVCECVVLVSGKLMSILMMLC